MTAERRIQRLRDFSTGVRGPYDGIADDIACVLEALSVAKLAHDMMKPWEKATLDDAKKHRAENAVLRQALQMIADESERHHEHNLVSGEAWLPLGYVTIRNIACDTLKT